MPGKHDKNVKKVRKTARKRMVKVLRPKSPRPLPKGY